MRRNSSQSKAEVWANRCVTQCRLCSARVAKSATKLASRSAAPRKKIADLLAAGKPHIAAIQVAGVVEDAALGEVYEVLAAFLGMLEAEAQYMGSSKVFPAKMAEPVASIVYASTTKCGRDLEELKVLRQLMEEQYRKEFVLAILSDPSSDWGRWVSPCLRCPCLDGQRPSGADKLKALKEIAEEHNVKWDEEAVRRALGPELEEDPLPPTTKAPAAAAPNPYDCAPVPPLPPPPQQQQQEQQQRMAVASSSQSHLLPGRVVAGVAKVAAPSPTAGGATSPAAPGNPYACAPVKTAECVTPKSPAPEWTLLDAGGGDSLGAAQFPAPAGTPRRVTLPAAAALQEAAAAVQADPYARLPNLRHVTSSTGDLAALGGGTGVTPPPRGWLLAADEGPAGMPVFVPRPSSLLPPPALQFSQQQQKLASPVLVTPGRSLASSATSSSGDLDRSSMAGSSTTSSTSKRQAPAAGSGQDLGGVAAGVSVAPLRRGPGTAAAAAGCGVTGSGAADSMVQGLSSIEVGKFTPAPLGAPPRLAMVGVGASVGDQAQSAGSTSGPGTPPAADSTSWENEMEELRARMEALRRA